MFLFSFKKSKKKNNLSLKNKKKFDYTLKELKSLAKKGRSNNNRYKKKK